jgi:hypothetical protein
MAIDPNILLRASEQFKPLALPDPMENYAKLMKIKAMQSEMESQGLDMAAKRQAAQDDATYRQMAMQGSVTPEMLESKGLYKQGGALRKQILDADKDKVDIKAKVKAMTKTDQDIAENQAKVIQEVSMALDQLPDDNARLQAWQTVGAPRLQQAGLQNIDPNVLPDINTRKMHAAQATALTSALDEIKAEREKGNIVATEVDKFDKVWGRDKKGNLTPTMLPNGQQLQKRAPTPLVVNAMNQAKTASTNRDMAEAIYNYELAPPNRFTPSGKEVMGEVFKIAQERGKAYDENKWRQVERSNKYLSGEGRGQRALTSNDTLFGHSQEVLESLGGANLNDTRVLNHINQWLSRERGTDAKYKDLKVASKVYGSELASMLGFDTGKEREGIEDLFNSVDSPASFKSAVSKAQMMAATRSAALANQYYRETGLDPVERGIIPERVAKAAANSSAAKGYEWAKKHRDGSGGSEKSKKVYSDDEALSFMKRK